VTAVAGNGEAPSRILVVDDTEANRDVLTRRLQKHGHQVQVAASGPAALALLAQEPFDLVLLDIMMPDMSGYEVLEQLKADESLRHVPVIMITSITDMDSVIRCIEMGAEDHLPKPFNATLLKARIDASLAKKRLRDREQLVARAMTRELEIGRNIQAGFLPTTLPLVPGFELAARFRPARQVAGDFYDAFALPPPGRTAIVVADVCDKGVAAALFMAVFRTLLRAVSREAYDAAPDAGDSYHLPRTVRVLSDYNASTHSAANMFATVFVAVLDSASGILTYVNAGHEAPMLLRAGGVAGRLPPTGPAVGLLEGLKFGVEQVALAPGDLLLAFTDGVTDARGADGTTYGEARLEAAASQASSRPSTLLERIEADLGQHTAGAEPFDDITMLALGRIAP
jgi:serine phosphatase RsbU (regulator of sigma subunit)